MTGRQRQRGLVLATGLFLIVLLGVFLVGIGRQATVSLALAGLARDHDRTFQAAEDALSTALAAATFRRQSNSPQITRPQPGTEVRSSLDYLGETHAIPHPAWQADRDAALVAHHFRVAVRARRHGIEHHLERDVAVVARRGIAASATLSTADNADNAPFGGAVIVGPWRALPP